MKLPLTYHIIYQYKGTQETHQFTADRRLNREMVEQVIEKHVFEKHGRGADITQLFVKSYNYHEND